ncbi:MAG: hypothetical protein AAF608_14905 [Pseudomonadota bacterium]
MTKILILLICAIAACTACVFFFSTAVFLLKQPALAAHQVLEIVVAFGLFVAASTTLTSAWQRKKAALWCWVPVFLIGAPVTTFWAYETTQIPEGMQFASEAEAANQTSLSILQKPTRAEFDQRGRTQRRIFLSLLGLLSFKMAALIFLHRKEVLR